LTVSEPVFHYSARQSLSRMSPEAPAAHDQITFSGVTAGRLP
jgi:hypothetical protein